ncbi:MAG: hypothetical protein F6K19_33085 [Cyanothece sp. SIO1E1]|nr:hypothetical protein [Cyanothece sp. SIO1E1]
MKYQLNPSTSKSSRASRIEIEVKELPLPARKRNQASAYYGRGFQSTAALAGDEDGSD